jgi:DNA mismatch repair protein MutS2
VHVSRASNEKVEAGTSHGSSSEVNLVGHTVDEALPRLDKALDDAVRADMTQLRVIHGFGKGTLRRAVEEFLHDHHHVAQVHVASEGRGGVTIVQLKE